MSRFSDAVQNEGVDPDELEELMPVYAVEGPAGVWWFYHAEDRERIGTTTGDQHAMVEFAMSEGWDLRDGPISAY